MCLILQYVLPTDSPHLAKSAFAIALSPMLWAQHKPDRFDSWSAGIVLLQLALPGLRQPRGLNLFKTEYERADYDIIEWKNNCRWISKRDTAVLDANDGAGGLGWLLLPHDNACALHGKMPDDHGTKCISYSLP